MGAKAIGVDLGIIGGSWVDLTSWNIRRKGCSKLIERFLAELLHIEEA